jgi:hypothetical protein
MKFFGILRDVGLIYDVSEVPFSKEQLKFFVNKKITLKR